MKKLFFVTSIFVFLCFSFVEGVWAIPSVCPGQGNRYKEYTAEGEKCYYCPVKGIPPQPTNCDEPPYGTPGVNIPVEKGTWAEELFGTDSLPLRILSPTKYISGETTIWVIVSMIISNLFVALFLVTIVAIVIGVLKWFASQGQEGKIESGQKWIRNAIMGFVATIVAFVLFNVGTYFIGVGNVFDLADNVSVCGDDVLYRYKQDKNLLDKDVECECVSDMWVCK